MGAWGVRAFDNDGANDWAYDLEKTKDLSLVEYPIKPSPDLIKRANAAIDRILGEKSELRELWEESDSAPQRTARKASFRSETPR